MYTIFILLAICLSAVAAVPASPQRIVGGSQTTIYSYPSISSLIYNDRGGWGHKCGGTILSQRAIITAAHCVMGDRAVDWRIRVGSTSSTVGGTIYNCNSIITNPSYVWINRDNDAAILRPASNILMGALIQRASYASVNYNLPDNSVVWAAGWGATSHGGSNVINLRHVQVWTVNSVTCFLRYASIRAVTSNMLCSGWLDVGGRDQCQGDSGGPLYHNRILVGISSWGEGCGDPYYPGVNTRVSRISSWIANNI